MMYAPAPIDATRLSRGAVAGVIGALAFVVVQDIDLRLFRRKTDDLCLIGGFFTDDYRRARIIGFLAHLVFGAAFGTGHALVMAPHLPGGPIRRGMTTAMIENFGFYPLTRPIERVHPWFRDGRLDSYWHPTALLQATLRHLTLGAVMGAVLGEHRSRRS